jgi:hypothetical protein
MCLRHDNKGKAIASDGYQEITVCFKRSWQASRDHGKLQEIMASFKRSWQASRALDSFDGIDSFDGTESFDGVLDTSNRGSRHEIRSHRCFCGVVWEVGADYRCL